MNNRVLSDRVLTRRSFLGVSAGMGLGVFLAACAPGGVAPQAPQAAAGNQAGAAAGGLAYQGELEYWDWDYDPRAALLEKYSNAWVAEHPGITLKRVSQAYADAQTKLLTAASSGNNPPFANIHNTWRPAIQRQGLLEPYPDDLLPFDKLLSTPYNRDPQTGKVYTCTFNYFCDELFFTPISSPPKGSSPNRCRRSGKTTSPWRSSSQSAAQTAR